HEQGQVAEIRRVLQISGTPVIKGLQRLLTDAPAVTSIPRWPSCHRSDKIIKVGVVWRANFRHHVRRNI
ncbi:MAG: hypothetical protein U9N44_00460, partial [Chloroflexota bacterium]|nr:hypothetical protein [Chloroflexota bacterium]